jgi:hypothetical protein
MEQLRPKYPHRLRKGCSSTYLRRSPTRAMSRQRRASPWSDLFPWRGSGNVTWRSRGMGFHFIRRGASPSTLSTSSPSTLSTSSPSTLRTSQRRMPRPQIDERHGASIPSYRHRLAVYMAKAPAAVLPPRPRLVQRHVVGCPAPPLRVVEKEVEQPGWLHKACSTQYGDNVFFTARVVVVVGQEAGIGAVEDKRGQREVRKRRPLRPARPVDVVVEVLDVVPFAADRDARSRTSSPSAARTIGSTLISAASGLWTHT